MNRAEFIERLTACLGDVPQTEREEAIQYYNDYFDDAGAENEAGVIASLGTPEKLAKEIKAGLGLTDGSNAGNSTEQGGTQKKKLSGGMIALIVIAVILTSPVWVGILGGLFGLAVGIVALVFGILVAVFGVGFGFAVAGFLVFCAGVVSLFVAPISAVCLIGSGMVVFAIGLVFIWLLILLAGVAFPRLIQGIGKLCGRLFHRGGAQA
jgi:uncharacterized membrane protein